MSIRAETFTRWRASAVQERQVPATVSMNQTSAGCGPTRRRNAIVAALVLTAGSATVDRATATATSAARATSAAGGRTGCEDETDKLGNFDGEIEHGETFHQEEIGQRGVR
ncbi:hypothetical protein [Rhodococcus erythropolis]|uniref:hypothetical protein n=1 Tax=Rhodococcus erythropolis TaxID=1833 RepID=UPI00366F3B64